VTEPGTDEAAVRGGPLRVVLVDDHRLFRAGVRSEIGERVEVVGEAGDVDEAIAVIHHTRPDVVLLDVHLPGGGGRAVLDGCTGDLPEVKFLALSVSDAADDVIGVVRGGARGYVTKAISADDLVDAVRRVADDDALDSLSPREREVMRLIARGYTYREVAKDLVLSVKTVETHVSAVLRKLQLSNRHELAKWAAARHLV
jgi:DNA-binding NarL/FixJ family response regulator